MTRALVAIRKRLKHTHKSLSGVRLSPVLPVVFYTGTRRWDSLGKLADLVRQHEVFEGVLPSIEPLYLSLRDVPPARLVAAGGFFGQLLRLVQERKARPAAFRQLLEAAVKQLETMALSERVRWLELLSYIHALIYHERDADEIPILQQTIESAVARDKYRREVSAMAKSYAQLLVEKGREEGREEGRDEGREEGKLESALATRRLTLCRQLTKKFGRLPQRMSDAINSTQEVAQLDAWLDKVVTANTLDDVGIPAPD